MPTVFTYPSDRPVTPLTADSFAALIEKPGRAFIHFAAIWNGYDRMIIPHVVQAAQLLDGKVRFAVMDVDDQRNWNLLAEHKMSNVPYFEYYEDGQRLEAGVGYDFGMKQLALLTKKSPQPRP